MKKLAVVLFCFCIIGCSHKQDNRESVDSFAYKTLPGKYLLAGDETKYLILNDDGSFESNGGLPGRSGEYILFKSAGLEFNGPGFSIGADRKDERTIVVLNGSAWVKQFGATATSQPTAQSSVAKTAPVSSGQLSNAAAQATMERWIKTREGGQVTVIGVQDLSGANQAQADIKVTNF